MSPATVADGWRYENGFVDKDELSSLPARIFLFSGTDREPLLIGIDVYDHMKQV